MTGGDGEKGGRFRTRTVLAIAAGHAVHDTFTAFVPPLLPLFITNLDLSKTAAGLLVVFLQAPWLLQPWIGHHADRRHARAIVIAAPAVSAIGICLLGLAPSYALLVPLLLLSGLASGALHAVGPAIVSGLSADRIGRGMGIWMVGGELGRTVGPVVAVTAVAALGLGGLPWLIVGGIAASALLWAKLGGIDGDRSTVGDPLPWRLLLRGMGPLLLPIAGILFLRAFLMAALNTFLPVYLTESGSELWIAGAVLTLLEGAGVCGALAGGAASDRIGRRRTIAIALLTTPLLLLLFLEVRGWMQIATIALLGFTGLSVTPVIMALVHESFPRNRALANGVYMLLNFLMRTAAILGLGIVGDLADLTHAYRLAAFLALAALPLVRFLPKRPGISSTAGG